ncbi:MAG: hypothetical protein QOH91_4708 [Mycobacterium sp.]|jgi:hypothetical protein|nr:hypothetical protein [Mycobacterium sp.]
MTAAAPSGAVTFLFTDVEGLTRRWEADADGMRQALAAHDEVMTPVINTSDVDSADGKEPKPIAAAGTVRVESRAMVVPQASAE